MIAIPITFLVVCTVMHFLQKREWFESKCKHKGIITLTPAFLIVGCVLLLVCCVGAITFYCLDNIGVSILFIALSSLPFSLILGYYGFSVVYDEKKLIFRRFYGHGKTVYYRDIVAVESGLDLFIRTANDTVKIPNYAINVTDFYSLLEEKIDVESLRSNQSEVPPRIRKFRDSVYRPRETIFALGLMLSLPIVWIAISIAWYCVDKNKKDFMGCMIMGIIFLVIIGLYVFFTVFAAKRAHASKAWRKVLRPLLKEGYFKEPEKGEHHSKE